MSTSRGSSRLSAGLGPAQRYRRWLSVLRGSARLVIGTRSAVFAPVADLGLVMVWDDGDDTLAEPRAPYPHAREVAMLRAHQLRCAALIGGYARTAEAQALVRSRWAHDLVAPRPVVRDALAARRRARGQRLRAGARPRRADRPAAVDGAARGSHGAGIRIAGAGSGAPARLCAGAGVCALPDRRPLQALHRPAVAARSRCRGGGVPVVWPRRTGAALRTLRVRRGARGGRRCPPHRRGTRQGVSRHHRHHLGRRRDGCRRARATGGRRRDTGRRAGRRRRLRRGAAARQLGAAGQAGSTCRRGHPAALDGGRRAGAQPRRRRRGRGGRRFGDSHRAGADPLGSGRPRRSRTRLPAPRSGCHPQCTWPPSTARPRRCTRCWTRRSLPDAAELLGPVDLPAGARRPPGTPADGPVSRMLVRVPRDGGLALAAALRRATAVLSARHDHEPVRVQIDPLHIG